MTAAVEQLCVILIEITQECIEAKVVGKRNTEVATEFVRPVFENSLLHEFKRNVLDALIQSVHFVCESTDSLAAELDGEVDVRRTHESGAEVDHGLNHVFVPFVGHGTADTEVRDRELDTTAESCVPLCDRFVEGLLGFFPVDFEIVEEEVLDNLQNIDFKPGNLDCGAFSPDVETAVASSVIVDVDVLALELEVGKPFDEVVGQPRHNTANAFEFPFSKLKGAKVVKFAIDFVVERSQVDAIRTELEFPVGTFVRMLVEDRLTHAELVCIGLGEMRDEPLVFVLALILLVCSYADSTTLANGATRLLCPRNRFFGDFDCH